MRTYEDEDNQGMTTNIDRAAEIISLATRGAHTTDGHPMKMSDHTAQIIAKALAKAGLLMPDGMNTQTETVGPYFPEDEEMPELPDGTDVTRIVGPWEEA